MKTKQSSTIIDIYHLKGPNQNTIKIKLQSDQGPTDDPLMTKQPIQWLTKSVSPFGVRNAFRLIQYTEVCTRSTQQLKL